MELVQLGSLERCTFSALLDGGYITKGATRCLAIHLAQRRRTIGLLPDGCWPFEARRQAEGLRSQSSTRGSLTAAAIVAFQAGRGAAGERCLYLAHAAAHAIGAAWP